jgi:hypothetical protein
VAPQVLGTTEKLVVQVKVVTVQAYRLVAYNPFVLRKVPKYSKLM